MGAGGKAGVHGLIGDFLVRIGGRQVLLSAVDERGKEHRAGPSGAHSGAECTRDLGLYADKLDVSQPE